MSRKSILDLLGVLFLVVLVGTTTYITANPNIRQLISSQAYNPDALIRQRERTGECTGKCCLQPDLPGCQKDSSGNLKPGGSEDKNKSGSCGDGACGQGESSVSCPGDCGPAETLQKKSGCRTSADCGIGFTCEDTVCINTKTREVVAYDTILQNNEQRRSEAEQTQAQIQQPAPEPVSAPPAKPSCTTSAGCPIGYTCEETVCVAKLSAGPTAPKLATPFPPSQPKPAPSKSLANVTGTSGGITSTPVPTAPTTLNLAQINYLSVGLTAPTDNTNLGISILNFQKDDSAAITMADVANKALGLAKAIDPFNRDITIENIKYAVSTIGQDKKAVYILEKNITYYEKNGDYYDQYGNLIDKNTLVGYHAISSPKTVYPTIRTADLPTDFTNKIVSIIAPQHTTITQDALKNPEFRSLISSVTASNTRLSPDLISNNVSQDMIRNLNTKLDQDLPFYEPVAKYVYGVNNTESDPFFIKSQAVAIDYRASYQTLDDKISGKRVICFEKALMADAAYKMLGAKSEILQLQTPIGPHNVVRVYTSDGTVLIYDPDPTSQATSTADEYFRNSPNDIIVGTLNSPYDTISLNP